MMDLLEMRKYPILIEVKARRGYWQRGVVQDILSRVGLLYRDTHQDFEPFQFRLEFCRRNRFKALILCKNQEDQDIYKNSDDFSELLAQLSRYSKRINLTTTA